MNTPNPFIPQGSLLEQRRRRSRMKLAVFCVLAVGISGLTAMLIQGCKREQNQAENLPPPETNLFPAETSTSPEATNVLPPETNAAAMLPPVISNPPVTTPLPPVAPPATSAVAPVPPAAMTTATTEYVVVRGDTFWGIARKFGVSVKALEDANPNIRPARLKVGQKLQIPAPPPGAASGVAPAMPGAAVTPPEASGEQIYVVKSGDTLSRIARRHGTTVKAIESENHLLTTRILVGQKLKIPANAAPVAPPETAPAAPEAPSNPPAGQ